MKKRAIVGGSGFVGRSLAKHLLSEFDVKILDVNPIPENLKGKASYAYLDIRVYEDILSQLIDVDLVIHTAIVQIPLINDNKLLGYQVNLIGTQNVCKAVEELPNIKGMILAGSWHTVGEKELKGIIDEEFGFRPDKVEERARLYALAKIGQESIVRFYDEMSDKVYGIIRMGTILGEGMPEKTAANIFIERGLRGESITPYKHSMYRPMLYINIGDICKAFKSYSKKILGGAIQKNENSLSHIVNVCHPEPITILELAEIIRDTIVEYSDGKIKPEIEIVDKDIPFTFTKEDKYNIKVNINRAKVMLEVENLKSPRESIKEIIQKRLDD